MSENDKIVKANFAINDCPLSVWRGISEPAKQYCNNQYWVRLKELLDKEIELTYLKLALENYAIMKDDHVVDADTKVDAPVVEDVKKEKEYMGSARRDRK